MLKEKFNTWLADPFLDAILVIVDMNVINLGYLEERSPYFTKLSDDGIEMSNEILLKLDIATIILETDD